MRIPCFAVSALVLSLAWAMPAQSGGVESTVRDMLEAVGAEIVECPDPGAPYARERICARHRPTLYAFRSSWNERMDDGAQLASRAKAHGDWIMDWGTCCYRDYVVDDGGFRVTLDFRSRLASVVYTESRSDPGAAASSPSIRDSTPPTHPPEARKQRIAGRVAVEALVQADGSVADARLVWACPQGYGMEQAALEAVRDWTFDPALVDGEPVEAPAVVVVDFRLKGRGKNKTVDIALQPPPVMQIDPFP